MPAGWLQQHMALGNLGIWVFMVDLTRASTARVDRQMAPGGLQMQSNMRLGAEMARFSNAGDQLAR